MDPTLVVVRPFGSYRRGDVITDATQVKLLQHGEHAADVVAIRAPQPGTTQSQKKEL